MEVVQGKSSDKKIIVAQEIAFAKVLAGNNKTLRDRALRKLKKWLSIRGHGKWTFTEDEFIRIWTGLFYCMWMSDKFLVQEELAENISNLIHCFQKNRESALLFMKCFNKRVLMEYEGLDQYRLDKFHMLIRRFLRQSLVYCKRLEWDNKFLTSFVEMLNEVVFHKDSALGYVLHFMNIFPEELAKVSKGKLDSKTVLMFIEPFVKLLAKTRDDRVQAGTLDFFDYMMRQTNVGVEFQEKFHVWKQLGFPGTSLNAIQRVKKGDSDLESDDDSMGECSDDEDEDEGDDDRPLDPRAGSVHVDLPQIPLDIDGLVALLKKQEISKGTTPKGRKKLRTLIEKVSVLKKGRFPARVKKDPIIEDNRKKPRLTMKTAKNLLKFTDELESGPIRTKELAKVHKQLKKQRRINGEMLNGDKNGPKSNEEKVDENDQIEEDTDEGQESENTENGIDSDVEEGTLSGSEGEGPDECETVQNQTKNGKFLRKAPAELNKVKKSDEKKTTTTGKNALENGQPGNKSKEEGDSGEDSSPRTKKKKTRRRKKKKVPLDNSTVEGGPNDREAAEQVVAKKAKIVNGIGTEEQAKTNGSLTREEKPEKETPVNRKNGVKRRASMDWLVQELDESDPEYWKIKPQKVVKLDGKPVNSETKKTETPEVSGNGEPETFTPVFWNKAKAKVLDGTKKTKKSNIFVNPMAVNNALESPSLRRISFALEKNMAQENEEYLEEVRNSPKVPFDGSKKPVQSALKSGLSPSPINPFYRLKKIKF